MKTIERIKKRNAIWRKLKTMGYYPIYEGFKDKICFYERNNNEWIKRGHVLLDSLEVVFEEEYNG